MLQTLLAKRQKSAPAPDVGTSPQTTTEHHVNDRSRDGKDRLAVSIEVLKAAFRENEVLRDYCSMPEKNRLEPDAISAHVLEVLLAVIRGAHASAGGQNIRLNPSRADQVWALAHGRWEILPLAEAASLLFRDAAAGMLRLADSAQADQLTPAERAASYLLPAEYRRRPERYEREGKSRLAAHLAALGTQEAPAPLGEPSGSV